MAKKSMILKQQKKQKFSTREYNRCKICGNSGSAVSASVSSRTKARSRVSERQAGNPNTQKLPIYRQERNLL